MHHTQVAYETLSDSSSRKDYDAMVERKRRGKREELREMSEDAVEKSKEKGTMLMRAVRVFLGPFWLPAVVFSVLAL